MREEQQYSHRGGATERGHICGDQQGGQRGRVQADERALLRLAVCASPIWSVLHDGLLRGTLPAVHSCAAMLTTCSPNNPKALQQHVYFILYSQQV